MRESRQGWPGKLKKFGSLAQSVEQLAFNQLVAGSNPARPTNTKPTLVGFLFVVQGSKLRRN